MCQLYSRQREVETLTDSPEDIIQQYKGSLRITNVLKNYLQIFIRS
jgi:hypothetical protein